MRGDRRRFDADGVEVTDKVLVPAENGSVVEYLVLGNRYGTVTACHRRGPPTDPRAILLLFDDAKSHTAHKPIV